MTIEYFKVGGFVRDAILGVQSKDIDYAVQAPSYTAMRDDIIARGGKIFFEKPEYLTIRAKMNGDDADFVLCRKEGAYSDARHPDTVEIGTIDDDLARRDFTMNAIAQREDGSFYDPFGGQDDIKDGYIRCVGDPVKIIVGDPEAPDGSPEHKGAIECLWEIFGGTITATGHKLLDAHVGLIYGDSITLQRAQEILAGLKRKGFASGNVVFGIGSYTYQYVTRDSYGTAIKATWGVVNGQVREISKNPKTDNGIKKSAVGLLRVEKEGDNYVLYDRQTPEQEKQGVMQEVFCDGMLLIFQTHTEIKARLANEAKNIYTVL